MADPILAGGIRVQAVWQGASALPEDRYITTWAFASDAAQSEAALQEACEIVRGFYTVVHPGSANKVSDYISGQVVNESLSHFRAYSMEDPPPREPFILPLGANTFSAAPALPSEVAVVMSFYAQRNLPSLRGRVYLGPLNTSSCVSNDGPARVTPTMRSAVAAAANAILNDQGPGEPVWCVLGNPGNTGYVLQPVTAGWVDDAFDTQKRRGEDATTRNLFGTP